MIETFAAASSGGGVSNKASSGKPTPTDYETFLTMLTTQLENQDPLDPVESQDLAVQLATFSGVEQQTLTNDLLAQLTQALGAESMSEMSNWIGREVLTDKPVSFSGTPIDVEFNIPNQATGAELIVLDEHNRELQRLTVPLDETSLSWAGADDSGHPFPSGNYRFELQGNVDGTPLPSRDARAFAEVAEVRRLDDQMVLRLSGGADLPAEEVSGFR